MGHRIHHQPWVRGRRTPQSIALRLRGGWRALAPGDRKFIAESEENAYAVVRCLNPEYGRALCRILGLPVPPDCWYQPVGHFGWLSKAERASLGKAERKENSPPTHRSVALRLSDGWNALRPVDKAFLRRNGYAVARKLEPSLGRATCILLGLAPKPDHWYRPIGPFRWMPPETPGTRMPPVFRRKIEDVRRKTGDGRRRT